MMQNKYQHHIYWEQGESVGADGIPETHTAIISSETGTGKATKGNNKGMTRKFCGVSVCFKESIV